MISDYILGHSAVRVLWWTRTASCVLMPLHYVSYVLLHNMEAAGLQRF